MSESLLFMQTQDAAREAALATARLHKSNNHEGLKNGLRWLGVLFGLQDAPPKPENDIILRDGDTQAIFLPNGDMHGTGLKSLHGLFHNETRHLGVSRLFINGQSPKLVNSAMLDDTGTVATIRMKQGRLAIIRRLVVIDGQSHEQLEIKNTGKTTAPCAVGYDCAGDFENSFAIRGDKRALRRLGEETFRASVEKNALWFNCSGITDEQTQRSVPPISTGLQFSASKGEAYRLNSVGNGAGLALQSVELAPGESACFERQASCCVGDVVPLSATSFQAAAALALGKRQERLAGFTRIGAPGQAGDFFHTAERNLNFLLTDTPYGLYPYAGTPTYNTLFGRDGSITAMLSEMLTPEIMKGVIRNLAFQQATETDAYHDAEPGKTLHELRLDRASLLNRLPYGGYYGNADGPGLLLIACGRLLPHLSPAAAREFYQPELLEKLTNSCNWLIRKTEEDGLLWFKRQTDAGLAIQSWMDSEDSMMHADGTPAELPIAALEVQAYVYAGFKALAAVHLVLGNEAGAENLESRAKALRLLIDQKFWDDELGTYALAIDSHGACRVKKSNAGHVLWADAAEEKRAAAVATLLLSPAMFSRWGVRTLANDEECYDPNSYHNGSIWPHDNAMCAIGLARYGYKKEAAAILVGMFDAYCATGELPELFQGKPRLPGQKPEPYFEARQSHIGANKPQAWAAAAPIGVLQALLGLQYDAPNNTIHFEKPYLPEFLGGEIRLDGLQLNGKRVNVMLTGKGYEVDCQILPGSSDQIRVDFHAGETATADPKSILSRQPRSAVSMML